MIFIKYEIETEERGKVHQIFYQVDSLPEEVLNTGLLLDTQMPVAEERKFKTAVLYVNPQTKELWYEYVDRPLTDEERIQELETENMQLKHRLQDTEQAVLELSMLLGGMM